MNADVAREKYVHLMTEIEDMEDKIERAGLKKNKGKMFTEKEVELMKENLAAKKNELARISDGCGKPHAH